MKHKEFKRVLIVNRGEIAIRIIRALRELGMESICLYSDEDANSSYVRLADYCYHLSGKLPQDTYLHCPKIIEAIKQTKADAVHPGYGFLAENLDFAKMVHEETTATFIGPNLKAMEILGTKISARKLMEENKIPIVPGCQKALGSYDELVKVVHKIGLPVILKASAGGGGKGMRIIENEEEILANYEACKRESLNYFNCDKIFCEKYIASPRHIEVQILCDKYNNGVHLYERECTIQRRHQKIIEESPSLAITDQDRKNLGELSLKIASLVKYEGVGTVEFLYDNHDNKFYFMEMNTRIQVEHPVTEMVTGVDLLKEQIKSAQGYPLQWKQEQITPKGHSIELRVTAEDPKNDFMPTSGYINKLNLPSYPFSRIDTFLTENYEPPSYYDSLIAKVIVWGQTREEALKRLASLMSEMDISGLVTNQEFLARILEHPDFIQNNIDTNFIAKNKENLLTQGENQDSKDDLNFAAIGAFIATKPDNFVYKNRQENSSHWNNNSRTLYQ